MHEVVNRSTLRALGLWWDQRLGDRRNLLGTGSAESVLQDRTTSCRSATIHIAATIYVKQALFSSQGFHRYH
jgi:hypothetical protein